jgi:hypothetical protein
MNIPSGIRTITMSLFALVAFTFASKTFAAVNAYIIFTDADGKSSKVTVSDDGTFKTSAMKAGRIKVQFFWDCSSSKSASLTVTGTPGGNARGISSPTGASADRESSAPSVSEITMTYEILSPRDAQSGMATGRRMHKPFIVTVSSSERLLPTVNKKLGSIDLDTDTDGITGKITLKDQNGKPMAMDDWSAPTK